MSNIKEEWRKSNSEKRRFQAELTAQELNILQGYADGLMPNAIAARLDLVSGSVITAKTRIIDKASFIFKLLDIENYDGFLPAIISKAIQTGQIENTHGLEINGQLTPDEITFANLNSEGKIPKEIAREINKDLDEAANLEKSVLEKYGVPNLNALAAKHTAIEMEKASDSNTAPISNL